MEFVISLVVLVVFAVLMIGNALKTSRASRVSRKPPAIVGGVPANQRGKMMIQRDAA